jgi:subtilisin family serine protease
LLYRLSDRAEEFFTQLRDFQQVYKSFVTTTGTLPQRRIRIGILDTGIDTKNKIYFQSGRLEDDWCISFVGEPHEFHDEDGHGTHCVSLLRKVAPDAEIYVAKVFSHKEIDLTQAMNIPKV